jgi:hypothetical protein
VIDEKETALGVTSTESGSPKESDSSISDLYLNVKCKTPLDLRTEMFVLDQLKKTLAKQYSMPDSTRYEIFSGVFAQCMEANEKC